jgi:hypothetical protein
MSTFTGKDLAALLKRRRVSVSAAAGAIGAHRNTLAGYIKNDEAVPLTIRLALAAWFNDVPPVERPARAKKN